MSITDKETALRIAKGGPLYFLSRSKKWMDDYDVVLAAVERNGDFLGNASDRLRSDHEIVKAATKHELSCLHWASHALQEDKDFVLELVRESEHLAGIIWWIDEAYDKGDKEYAKALITAAIEGRPMNIAFLPPDEETVAFVNAFYVKLEAAAHD